MKLVIQIIVVVLVFILIAANAQEERRPAAPGFDYRQILRAAYAQAQEQPQIPPAPAPPPAPTSPAPGREARRSGRGPELLPTILRAPVNDLTGDAEFAARRAAGNATKLRVVPKPRRDYSLEEFSQFLGDAESCVILPKGSVVHCPEPLATRVLATPRGKLMNWQEFLVAHRAWITTREVNQAQIRGEAAFTESDRESFHKGGKLVVATFRGHPVTVLTPVPTPP